MKKQFFISTAIDYPSSRPHLGHAFEKIVADAISRFKRIQGFDVYFSTGTDEHGLKIQRCAEREGKTPKVFVDEMSQHFKEMCEKLGISYDDFIRTTEKRHEKVAQDVFKKLWEKKEIYKDRYKGLYCVECETFYSKGDLIDGKCPVHKKEPDFVDEENYFFKMSKYRDKLVEHIKKNKNFIIPEPKRIEILNRLKEPLKDLSVSRTSFKWGIPVPIDDKHVQYVWMDALLNYISTIDYPDGEKFKKFWPADVHLIGKDIVWHHTVIWGSILMALGLQLPKTVMVHGFITVEGQKMSKSIGNVVNPMDLIKEYGADVVRYYLLNEIPTFEDGDFSETRLIEKTNNELIGNFGNFVYRVLTFLKANFNSVVPEPDTLKKEDKEIVAKVGRTKEKIRAHMEDFRLREALQAAMELAAEGNRYFQSKKPWETLKKDPEDCANTLYVSANCVRSLAVLFWPFVPFACERLWKQLKLEAEAVGGELNKQLFEDVDKLTLKPGHIIGDIEPLFKKIE